jgi:hypothetical protein
MRREFIITAYQELVARSSTGRLPPHLDSALKVLADVKQYAADNNVPMASSPAAVPVPTDKGSIDREYGELVSESAKRRLSSAELDRMNSLKSAQLAREPATPEGASPAEIAAHRKALGLPAPPPTEYQRLVGKSPSGLTPADHSRLHALAGERAVAEGKAAPEDIAVEEATNV